MAAPEVVSRQQQLDRLREMTLDEGRPIVERAEAMVARQRLVYDILTERLRELNDDERGSVA